MPALTSFSPEVAQPFFTFHDHLREARKSLSAEPSGHAHAGREIATATAMLLKKFLSIPDQWQICFEPPDPEQSGYADFSPLVNPETGEISAYLHDGIKRWDATSALPYMEIDFNHSSAIRFGTNQGFGIPDGPRVTIFEPKGFKPSGDHFTDQFSGVMWSAGINIQMLWIFSRILEDLERRGMETLRRETAYKAAVLNQAVSTHPLITPVTERSRRSAVLLVVRTRASHANALALYLERFRLLPGRRNDCFAFTNFPTHSKESAELLADCLTAFNGSA